MVAKDFSCDNALRKPYVIQCRIPGNGLNSIWDTFNHSQQRTIASEMGRTVRALLSLESPVVGIIEAMPEEAEAAEHPKIVPFELKESDSELVEELALNISSNVEAPQVRETTADFFKAQFGRWRAHALTRPFDRDTGLFGNLSDTIYEMDKLDVFNNAAMHCLCHVDLHSCNIMAEIQSDSFVKITAILNSDEAIIVPIFVKC